MTIIASGDSWTYGSELVATDIKKRYPDSVHPGEYDYLQENDEYRISNVYLIHLGKLFNANTINLSFSGLDNSTIFKNIITYVTSNYIINNKPTDDLLLIVGLTTPERRAFWYKDDKISQPFIVRPHWWGFPETDGRKVINESYIAYLNNPEEFYPNYIMEIFNFQNFCKTYNLKWIIFNAFFESYYGAPIDWIDANIIEELKNINKWVVDFNTTPIINREFYKYDYIDLWNTIDDKRFYKKNEKNFTFKSFISQANLKKPFNNWHPSEEAHEAWGNELYSYITKNNLI
jgi:hypothetical protein